ncbi:hypothetical protein [Kitasatospora sp. NPDC056531]|uniref:MerR family transcriptional regulator n=1 Tax=Kitasatospora sp. NPDC056531 TaxID=3345856 RepID=UPI0036C9008F
MRHYHRHGLVDEPQRDASGYRRYGSEELLRPVQVRTPASSPTPAPTPRCWGVPPAGEPGPRPPPSTG